MGRRVALARGSAGGGFAFFALRALQYLSTISEYDGSVPPTCDVSIPIQSAADTQPIRDSGVSFHDRDFHLVIEARVLLAFLIGVMFWPTVELLVIIR